jgi:hypothetical protein
MVSLWRLTRMVRRGWEWVDAPKKRSVLRAPRGTVYEFRKLNHGGYGVLREVPNWMRGHD